MARFVDYQPQLRVVNSVGTVIEGPYRLDVAGNPPTPTNPSGPLGIILGSTEPWYVEQKIAFPNYQWSDVAYLLGYDYYVNLNFAFIEGQAIGGNAYGLTLLDRLFQISLQTQVPYAALQFSLFALAPFFGVVPAGNAGFHPQKAGGKQGYYELALSFKTRDLQATPQPWARGLW